MIRWLVGVSSTFVLVGSTGCGQPCTPEPDITVTLAKDVEDVRALPVLSSGKLSLLGVDVPDIHGDVSVSMQVSGADTLTVDALTFAQQVAGQPKDIELVRVQRNDAEFTNGDQAQSGSKFRFRWRIQKLAEYALVEGAAAVSNITMNWRFAGCRNQTGTATLDVAETVRSVNTLKNLVLKAAEAGRLDLARGAKAKMTVTSNSANDVLQGISEEKLQVTFFSEGLPPLIVLGRADASKIAMQLAGVPRNQLQPGEFLDIFTSSNASVGMAPYDHAGEAASATALVGGGKALVKLEVTSEKASSTMGPQKDVIYSLVDVP